MRELARRFGLAVADKHDSQDICFVPTGRYTDIIERLRPGAVGPGEIVDLDGRVLGRHDGIIHFTVGQRRGLGIAAGAPLYVVRLDAATAASWSARARRCARAASRCATSTGSATARSKRRSAQASRDLRAGALDPAAAAGVAARGAGGGYRSRTGRRRRGRVARPGLRVLRCGRGQARVLGGGFIAERDRDARCRHEAGAAARRGHARLTRFRAGGDGRRHRPRGGRKGV